MSHSPTVFSPPGTPLPDCTVGELVAARPGRSRVFQGYGIDFCCQGGRTLREACERKGLPLDTVVDQLEAESADRPAPENNPATLPPAELAAYIVARHHAFLRNELPRLRAMSERVAKVHGGHTPAMQEVFDVLTAMADELDFHMAKEEQILFPAIIAMSRGEIAPQSLDGPINCMIHEHDDAGAALARLRELTGGYAPPDCACNTWRALYAGLAELEGDLHRHIHLENAVLFPCARSLAGNL
jgi:regulator of cell morphogenesis and NO signaling